MAPGQLADAAPHRLHWPVELSDPEEAVDGRARGGPVVGLDPSFQSLIPENRIMIRQGNSILQVVSVQLELRGEGASNFSPRMQENT